MHYYVLPPQLPPLPDNPDPATGPLVLLQLSPMSRWPPDQVISVPVSVSNPFFSARRITQLGLQFADFFVEGFDWSCDVEPRTTKAALPVALYVPPFTGPLTFSACYHAEEMNPSQGWQDAGDWEMEQPLLTISSAPRYDAFFTRSNAPVDYSLGNSVEAALRQWGFEPATVGQPERASEEDAPRLARDKITAAQAVVALATPRLVNPDDGTWRAFEWLYAEGAIAYAQSKPLLILRQVGVELASFLTALISRGEALHVEFDGPSDVVDRVYSALPAFRQQVSTHRASRGGGWLPYVGVFGLGALTAVAGGRMLANHRLRQNPPAPLA